MQLTSIPKLSMAEGLKSPFQAAMPKMQMDPEVQKPSFQDAMMNTIDQINQTAAAPDTLMRDAMTTGGVDVHDVMVANAKAELVMSVTTQVATKVVQAYDRILQIQI